MPSARGSAARHRLKRPQQDGCNIGIPFPLRVVAQIDTCTRRLREFTAQAGGGEKDHGFNIGNTGVAEDRLVLQE